MHTTKNKQVIRTLYETYRREYLNELYDTPLQYKQQDASKYSVLGDDNTPIAYFLFTFRYDINTSPIDYKKYNQSKYWDVSWYWDPSTPKDQKNSKNFIRITSTSFKIVTDFIESHNNPPLLSFSGMTESHERIYSNKLFVDRWNTLLGNMYYTMWDDAHDKMWIVNKNFYRNDESRIHTISQQMEKPTSEVYRITKFPNKGELKGIQKQKYIKEQLKRIILKQIYLR